MNSNNELRLIQQQLAQAVEQLDCYKRLLKAMEKGELTDELFERCPRLVNASKEVEKLEYRAKVLRQSIAVQKQINANCKRDADSLSKSRSSDNGESKRKEVMNGRRVNSNLEKKVHVETKNDNYIEVEDPGSSMLYFLKSLFAESVSKAFPGVVGESVVITEATQIKFGDYQFNSAMAIAQKLKLDGLKISPRDVAQKIMVNLRQCEEIEKVEIAGPGYINIFLNTALVASGVANIALNGVAVPRLVKRRVVVDFSSPNIAKEMHVGHLRSTIIGDSISRLLEFVGFDVLRVNHIGDWGTQFGMLIAHLRDTFPNFLNEIPPISDLQAFYKESKKRFDEDPEFKSRAYECVVKLQNHDPEFVKAWKMICDVSRNDFTQIYDRLDIDIVEKGESFYQSLMMAMVKEFDDQGVLENDDGRKILRIGDGVPLTVVKSDGGFTYDTSDLAALRYRLFNENADWIIYVVDAGQGPHFDLVFAAGQKLGWYDQKKKRVEHIGFGLVLGEDRKKFKTRSGETIRLTDLLDEGLKRATAKLIEKERDKVMSPAELTSARDAIAYGCIKYTDLSQTRTQDYVFSFDKMLDDRGNTAVYLLYAYTRIRSICRNSGVSKEKICEYINEVPNGVLPLKHENEFLLAKTLLKFTDCLLTVLDNLYLHQLCDYVYSVSTTFHDFYNVCYVIQKDKDGTTTIHYHRLVLCHATADVMANCFKILGFKEIEKM